jgi:GTPase involved in cell partitioning and DNA repair
MSAVSAQNQPQVMDVEAINVDGYVKEKPVVDHELKSIQEEIKKQKQEIVLNREKAKEFKVLSKSVEKLSETTEEYILEKRAAQAEIAEYNLKIRCLQDEFPGKECDKFLKK